MNTEPRHPTTASSAPRFGTPDRSAVANTNGARSGNVATHGAGDEAGNSLLTPEDLAAIGARSAHKSAKATPAKERWDVRLDRRIRAGIKWWWNRPRVRWSSIGSFALIAAVWAFIALRPTPQPNFATAPMDTVLEYTLLEDDFNRLPIDTRLDLLRQLIERVKTMGASDSVLMAAFAASIEGDLRDQMMKNASKLVLDVWDKFAIDYVGVPPDDRPAYLDQKYLDLLKMMETLAGQESDKTDAQRLDEARRQAKRDEEIFASGRGPDAAAMAGMASFLRNGLGQHSSPQQQLRGQQLMRDMTRHFRGRDVETGQRK
ncbi:MAG: hypothetical protein KF768_04560 [Phycisphaeraceae bacterium]|nr:hypothetical protein [Phycisphaeraceae bacterium]